ncbi:MAG: sigma-70 family RNA polymerase sigma factor [Clostridiales bacterium]|nr:sigma-70 family RNA polymerase sigma factor [Clostridiales bacterium]
MKDYSILTDEELIECAKNGDTQAENSLIKRYTNLILKIINQRVGRLDDYKKDEFLQTGRLAVSNAIKAYKGSSSFTTFAYVCIDRRILDEIKGKNRKKDVITKTALSLNSSNPEDISRIERIIDLNAVDPESKIISEESVAELWVKFEKVLSKFEFEVFTLYLKNYSYKEIATKLEKEEKAINNAVQRIRKKLIGKI